MKGLSVIVRNKAEFERIKEFLGEEILYIDWIVEMSETLTGIIIHYFDDNVFSIGSVGCAEYQETEGIRLVEFSQFFKF